MDSVWFDFQILSIELNKYFIELTFGWDIYEVYGICAFKVLIIQLCT